MAGERFPERRIGRNDEERGKALLKRALDVMRIPRDRPRAPLPEGPLTGRRKPWRRVLARTLAACNRSLSGLPPGRWWHRRVLAGLETPEIRLKLVPSRSALSGMRIAFLSDLHAGNFLDASDLRVLFERVAASDPDLVLFGGDLINTRTSELHLFHGPLSVFEAPLGVFAVPGNHDLFWGPEAHEWRAFLAELGVRPLVNQGIRLEFRGTPFWLAGVDDLTEGRPDLERALEGWREGETCICLSHHPDFFFEAAAVGVDLVLAGHTHGGQIRFGSWMPIRHSRFGWHEGLFEQEGSRLYVSRGVGTTILPVRFGAPPEIPFFVLE